MSVEDERTPGGAPPPAPNAHLKIIRASLLATVIAVSVGAFLLRGQANKLAAFGYPGIFLLSVLSSATVLLPAPGIAFVFAMGSVFNPLFVGFSAAAGAAVGEISGYAAGVGGRGVIERVGLYSSIMRWMQRYGILIVILLAAVPNPFFDLAGMAAGALKMPIARFVLACFLGNVAKMLALAYTGDYSIGWMMGLLR